MRTIPDCTEEVKVRREWGRTTTAEHEIVNKFKKFLVLISEVRTECYLCSR